jgi:hypothetical protein
LTWAHRRAGSLAEEIHPRDCPRVARVDGRGRAGRRRHVSRDRRRSQPGGRVGRRHLRERAPAATCPRTAMGRRPCRYEHPVNHRQRQCPWDTAGRTARPRANRAGAHRRLHASDQARSGRAGRRPQPGPAGERARPRCRCPPLYDERHRSDWPRPGHPSGPGPYPPW